MPILAILQTPEIEVHWKCKFHKCKLLCTHNTVLKEVLPKPLSWSDESGLESTYPRVGLLQLHKFIMQSLGTKRLSWKFHFYIKQEPRSVNDFMILSGMSSLVQEWFSKSGLRTIITKGLHSPSSLTPLGSWRAGSAWPYLSDCRSTVAGKCWDLSLELA